MNIALVIVHNQGDQGNFDQIEALKNLITRVTDHHEELNEEGALMEYDTYHYEINNLGVEQTLRCYQIFPYGVTPPSNKDDIDSHKVYYGAGDEDKTGDHPRFFNWGLKRATDYGADLVIHLEDHRKLDFKKLLSKLQKVADKNDTTEFVEDQSCKISSLKLLKQVGQLDERGSKNQSIADLKQRVLDKGMKNG